MAIITVRIQLLGFGNKPPGLPNLPPRPLDVSRRMREKVSGCMAKQQCHQHLGSAQIPLHHLLAAFWQTKCY